MVGENKTTITASEFLESDGIADTVRGTLAYVKQFGDESSESEEPLQSPIELAEDAVDALQEGNQENGIEFAGHYHKRSLRERPTTISIKKPLNQSQVPKSSKSMGRLNDYTPQQIANMDVDQLTSLLQHNNLLKRSKSSVCVNV